MFETCQSRLCSTSWRSFAGPTIFPPRSARYQKRKPCGTAPEDTWNYSFKKKKNIQMTPPTVCSLVKKNMVSCRFSRNPLIGVGFSMMVEVVGISVRGCCWSTPVYPVCKFHQTAVHECWDVSIFERLKTYPCVCVWSTITSPNLQVGWHISLSS